MVFFRHNIPCIVFAFSLTMTMIAACITSISLHNNNSDLTKILKHTYSLPQSYSINQASKDGIVDVSVTSNGRNLYIESFLRKAVINRRATLRTASIGHVGELLITIYSMPERVSSSLIVKAEVYDVQLQRSTIYYVSRDYEIYEKEDGIFETRLSFLCPCGYTYEQRMKLRNCQHEEATEATDILLYSWKESP